MSWLANIGQSSDPKDNTALGYARRAAQIGEMFARMLKQAALEAERAEAREKAAEARLADAQKLLWMWVLDGHPSGEVKPANIVRYEDDGVMRASSPAMDYEPYAEGFRDGSIHFRACIEELAEILGEDIEPEKIQLERFKRDQERAQNQTAIESR